MAGSGCRRRIEGKREANLVKHGVDFADAVEVFADPLRIERVDQRRAYAEKRRQAVGTVRGHVLFVEGQQQ
jgi:hypothetical protein